MRSATAKRLRSSWLLLAGALAGATFAAAACSGSSGKSGAGSPTPSPIVFTPTNCHVVWITNQPAANVIDYYLIDAPVSVWAAGTTSAGYFQGDPTGATDIVGAYVRGFNIATQMREAAMVATSGTFQIALGSSDPIGIGNSLSILDTTPQDYFLLATNGALTTDEGPSGTGSFDGVWSDLLKIQKTQGVGTITVTFEGTSLVMGQDQRFGECYDRNAPSFAPATLDQLLNEAGSHAAQWSAAR